MSTYKNILERMQSGSIHGMHMSDEERYRLDLEIDELLLAIALLPNMECAEAMLNMLGEIQTTLATITYKYQVALTAKQNLLVYEYDRWDDLTVRIDTYTAIKNNTFLQIC